MKNITISGGIGKDAVTRTTPAGHKVTGFSVAVSEGFGDKKRTLWFDCSIWGDRGEKIAQYLTKGSKVSVAGDLSTREHEGKTYLTIRAAEVTLMGGGEQREERQERKPDGYGAGAGPNSGHPVLDDEIPFAPEWR